MKRIVLAIISVCLVVASVFGIFAAGAGIDEVTDIRKETKLKNDDIAASVKLIKETYAELTSEDGLDSDAKSLATGIVTDQYGSAAVAKGQAEYDKGKAEYDKGKAEYDKGKAKLEKGKADYAAAEKLIAEKEQEIAEGERMIAEAEPQIEEAKRQRDEAQKKLDLITPVYEEVKPLYDKLKSSSKEYVQLITVSINTLITAAGYTNIDQLFADYEDGVKQLEAANMQIAEAEKQLSDGKQQVADGKKLLAIGKAELAAAKEQLADGEKKLAAGKKELDAGKAKLKSAQSQLAAGKRQMAQNSQKMAADLENLKDLDDAQELVDNGIEILLSNDDIAREVSDRSDYDEVLTAAQEFVDGQIDTVEKEISLRSALYSLLKYLCIVCGVAGAAGLIAVIVPRIPTLMFALCTGAAAALCGVGLNAYGMTKDYRYFVYTLEDGTGTGSLQHALMVGIMIAAILLAIVAFVCFAAYRKGSKIKLASAVSSAPVPEAMPVRTRKAAARARAEEIVEPVIEKSPVTEYSDEDDNGWDAPRPAPPRPAPSKAAPPKPAAPKASTARAVRYASPSAPKPAAPKASTSMDEAILRMQEQTKKLNEESARLEAESRDNDYEAARKDYEEALRRFEEARKNRGN